MKGKRSLSGIEKRSANIVFVKRKDKIENSDFQYVRNIANY